MTRKGKLTMVVALLTTTLSGLVQRNANASMATTYPPLECYSESYPLSDDICAEPNEYYVQDWWVEDTQVWSDEFNDKPLCYEGGAPENIAYFCGSIADAITDLCQNQGDFGTGFVTATEADCSLDDEYDCTTPYTDDMHCLFIYWES